MDTVDLQPDDESVKQYYEKLQEYRNVDETHEGTVQVAFQHLLSRSVKEHCDEVAM